MTHPTEAEHTCDGAFSDHVCPACVEEEAEPTEVGERERLKPCPFCGERAPLMYTEPATKALHINTVICQACEATGPEAPTTDEAVTAWNRRAADLLRTEPGGGRDPEELIGWGGLLPDGGARLSRPTTPVEPENHSQSKGED